MYVAAWAVLLEKKSVRIVLLVLCGHVEVVAVELCASQFDDDPNTFLHGESLKSNLGLLCFLAEHTNRFGY
jgi:hypothetical protein